MRGVENVPHEGGPKTLIGRGVIREVFHPPPFSTPPWHPKITILFEIITFKIQKPLIYLTVIAKNDRKSLRGIISCNCILVRRIRNCNCNEN